MLDPPIFVQMQVPDWLQQMVWECSVVKHVRLKVGSQGVQVS